MWTCTMYALYIVLWREGIGKTTREQCVGLAEACSRFDLVLRTVDMRRNDVSKK